MHKGISLSNSTTELQLYSLIILFSPSAWSPMGLVWSGVGIRWRGTSSSPTWHANLRGRRRGSWPTWKSTTSEWHQYWSKILAWSMGKLPMKLYYIFCLLIQLYSYLATWESKNQVLQKVKNQHFMRKSTFYTVIFMSDFHFFLTLYNQVGNYSLQPINL